MRIISAVILSAGLAVLPLSAATERTNGTKTAQTAAVGQNVVTDAAEQPNLEELLWIARPIVVFADTPNDPRFQQQMQFLEERRDELDERDVEILVDTDPAADGPLRQELRPRDFGLVVLDKDGSVVQRRPTPTTARELINLIDRLPSRRQETGSFRQ
jgi:Domain of unknown function (DUF4174)